MTDSKSKTNDEAEEGSTSVPSVVNEESVVSDQKESSTESEVAAERANDTEDPNEEPHSAETQNNNATPQADLALDKKSQKRSLLTLVLFVLLLLVIGSSAGAAYIVWQEYNVRIDEIAVLKSEIEQQKTEALSTGKALKSDDVKLKNQISELQERIKGAEARLAHHNKRLLSMSTTSREDWLLAEAEYLLKLANQRVLVERSAGGAEALLVEADDILRGLDDPDLFSLRQAIAEDLAELRLANAVDVEGLYLRLGALAGQVDALPLQPTRQELMVVSDEILIPVAINEGAAKGVAVEENQSEGTFWQKVSGSISSFSSSLDNYIQFHSNVEEPTKILPPSSKEYLQQNLRLKIEKSQLALMREQQSIYVGTLEEADNWVQRYYPSSQKVLRFRKQLAELKEKQIVQELPDITQSLELLHAYIEKLHKLEGASS